MKPSKAIQGARESTDRTPCVARTEASKTHYANSSVLPLTYPTFFLLTRACPRADILSFCCALARFRPMLLRIGYLNLHEYQAKNLMDQFNVNNQAGVSLNPNKLFEPTNLKLKSILRLRRNSTERGGDCGRGCGCG